MKKTNNAIARGYGNKLAGRLILATAALLSVPVHATSYTWSPAGSNVFWGDSANWTPNTGFPNAAGDSFTNNIGSMSLADASGLDSSFTLSGINSSTGSVNVSINNVSGGSGILIFDNGASTASITATKNSSKALTFNVGIQLNSNTGVRASTTSGGIVFNRAITGTGGLIFSGQSGTTTQGVGYTYLSSAASYLGDTTLNGSNLSTTTSTSTNAGGKLQINGTNYLPTTTILNVNANLTAPNAQGSRLNLNGFSQTVAGLSGTSGTAVGIITNDKATATTSVLTINNSADFTYNGNISDALTGGNLGVMAVTKSGTGTQTLAGANTYSGATVVNGGTLVINSTGTLTATSGVTINGGRFEYANNSSALASNVTVAGGDFKYNSSQAYAGTLSFTSGTISGSGNLSGVALSIGSGQTLSPGNSPGTLDTGSQTWANGGNYLWEINALATSAVPGSEGSDPGWDLASIGGNLDITAGAGQFNLEVDSLLALDNWNSNSNYQWRIAAVTGSITGFSSSAFNIDTSAFSDENPFTGSFSVSNVGSDIYLNYTAVPEPSTYGMLLVGLGSLWVLRRNREKAKGV